MWQLPECIFCWSSGRRPLRDGRHWDWRTSQHVNLHVSWHESQASASWQPTIYTTLSWHKSPASASWQPTIYTTLSWHKSPASASWQTTIYTTLSWRKSQACASCQTTIYTTLSWHESRASASWQTTKYIKTQWCGYLSRTKCRLFAYGPADATATPKPHHLLPDLNPAYPRWPAKRGR